MRIGIDCRLYGPKHTGIGRYVQNLVENLLQQDNENEYVLFVKKDFENCPPAGGLKIVKTGIEHYSLKEQILLPKLIKKQKVDLMHFPHFNVPVFYSGKYIVTVHDLIKHFSKGSATTTKSPFLYWIKYFCYKLVFFQAVKKAVKIITPSNFVKEEVSKKYNIDLKKIAVTYEGVDNKIKYQSPKIKNTLINAKILEKYGIKRPFLLYVGSVYPHKNIERLIKAVKFINETITYHLSPITLVIVCARNVFSERLHNFVKQNKAENFVCMTGFVLDEELAVLYQKAEAFIFPTLSEGFGLPGLEAMSLGCPVVCSDIVVLKEIYKNAALYFDPFCPDDIAEKILKLLKDKTLKDLLKDKGVELSQTYFWQKTAQETLKIYKAEEK